MAGITPYGASVPILRMPLAAMGGGTVRRGCPALAVANWDDDAVTIAVAAAIDSRRGRGRDHRRVAYRGRSLRARVGGPLRRRPRLPGHRARGGARVAGEDGARGEGLREAGALRSRRAESRRAGARARLRAGAGAGR